MKVFDIKRFYAPGSGIEACADASDLGFPPGPVSTKIGAWHEGVSMTYLMTGTSVDADGDYRFWTFEPVVWNMGMLPFPRIITIYND